MVNNFQAIKTPGKLHLFNDMADSPKKIAIESKLTHFGSLYMQKNTCAYIKIGTVYINYIHGYINARVNADIGYHKHTGWSKKNRTMIN